MEVHLKKKTCGWRVDFSQDAGWHRVEAFTMKSKEAMMENTINFAEQNID